MTPEFMAGERVLTCTECGGAAEGNASWTDGRLREYERDSKDPKLWAERQRRLRDGSKW